MLQNPAIKAWHAWSCWAFKLSEEHRNKRSLLWRFIPHRFLNKLQTRTLLFSCTCKNKSLNGDLLCSSVDHMESISMIPCVHVDTRLTQDTGNRTVGWTSPCLRRSLCSVPRICARSEAEAGFRSEGFRLWSFDQSPKDTVSPGKDVVPWHHAAIDGSVQLRLLYRFVPISASTHELIVCTKIALRSGSWS